MKEIKNSFLSDHLTKVEKEFLTILLIGCGKDEIGDLT